MKIRLITTLSACVVFIGAPLAVHGAILSIEPTAGSFVVGSTFNVSIFLDTEDELVNAVEAHILFPPDKLQVVSPSAGLSIVNVWTVSPSFNNQKGTINFQGVIPSGIYAEKGLISTITFRAKTVGRPLIRLEHDKSSVLLSDGQGTDALHEISNGFYNIILPPPAGPFVVSETHPQQSSWYANTTPILSWASGDIIEGYSYVLSNDPITVPDNIPEGINTTVAYRDLSGGTHYFSIKALRNGAWGGITKFAINIDAEIPAEFPINIRPHKTTTSKRPTVYFETTDANSGIDRYEYRVISLNPHSTEDGEFFFETSSPLSLELENGNYNVIVRAYDKANNVREIVQRLEIVTPLVKMLRSVWMWAILITLVPLLGLFAWQTQRWHTLANTKRGKRWLSKKTRDQIEELKKYRKKYGKLAILFAATVLVFSFNTIAHAVPLILDPPTVTTIAKNISNEDIFYIGGKTEIINGEVVLFLQNTETGETFQYSVKPNRKGDWLYRHDSFLLSGTYALWAQVQLGEKISPPTAQIQLTVSKTALQMGSSRISYETLYMLLALFLLLVVIVLTMLIIFHGYHGRKKHLEFRKEIREAEEAIRSGFAVLRRDIEAELAVVRGTKFSKRFSTDEKKRREKQLLEDLESIHKQIGKEVLDIEKIEGLH